MSKAANCSDLFSIFQLIVLHNHWFDFLFQCLFSIFSFSDGPHGFRVTDFFLASGFDSATMLKCSYYSQISVVKLIFLRNYRLVLFHQGRISKVSKLDGFALWETINPVLNQNYRSPKKPEKLIIWAHLVFQTLVSPKQLA